MVAGNAQLDARTAIVTEAARGIGAAVALRLSRDGLRVGVLDLDAAHCAETVDQITAAGGRALALSADVADEDSVAARGRAVRRGTGPAHRADQQHRHPA